GGHPQVDGIVQSAVEADEDRELKKDRQTAGKRIVVVFAEQLHLRSREFFLLVRVLLSQFGQLRLQLFHFLRADGLLLRQRVHAATHQGSQQNNGDAVRQPPAVK